MLVADVLAVIERVHRPSVPAGSARAARLPLYWRSSESWDGDRARSTDDRKRIPDDLGTAVNVMAMVFGNLRRRQRHRRCVHPRPGDGAAGSLRRLPAQRPRRGRRRGHPQHAVARRPGQRRPGTLRRAVRIMDVLETHYRDLCDIEFTIERGRLWMLQTRVGKRTAGGGLPHRHPARRRGPHRHGRGARRVTGAQLARLMFPQFDRPTAGRPWVHGVAASPGAAVGSAVFDSKRAAVRAAAGDGRPGSPRDQPRRPRRHDRGAGGADQSWRQDVARRCGRARHGQALRRRRRVARGRRGTHASRLVQTGSS